MLEKRLSTRAPFSVESVCGERVRDLRLRSPSVFVSVFGKLGDTRTAS